MKTAQTAVIHRLCSDHSEAIAAYRFFNNDNVPMKTLQEALVDPIQPQVEGKHVLCIEDTTEINYTAHSGRLKASDEELGPVGNNRDVGFFLHPSLVLDAASGFALGFADVHLWNRSWDKLDKHARDYKSLPLEQKESFRWIEAAQRAKAQLSKAAQVTFVADREADIYQIFSRLPDARTQVLIRSCQERRIGVDGVEGLLSEHLSGLEWAGEIEIKIRGNNGRKKRRARLQVRFSRVELLRPSRAKAEPVGSVAVYVVEVVERAETVPPGEEPIRWCLLTTHRIETLVDALGVVSYYKARWQIEQLFRLLKSESLELESSQLERGAALKKLCIMSLHVALVQLQLVTGRAGSAAVEASLVFSGSALVFLGVLQSQLEGKTKKQQCAHGVGSLAWASWVIGRLGGWKGYASQSPPGPITMRRGLERVMSQFSGWQLAQVMQTKEYA